MTAKKPKKNIQEIRSAQEGFHLLASWVFDLKESLTPKQEEWQERSDARRMALGNIYRPCLTTPILLFNMLNALGNEEGLKQFAYLMGMENDAKNRENAFWDIVDWVLHHTILMVQFQVENLFQNLWRELGFVEVRNFIQLSEKLIGYLKIIDGDKYLHRLKALANLRNSLHNNGIHNNQDFAFGISMALERDNKKIIIEANYAFKKNQKVVCCGPVHVLGLCAGTVEVIQQILSNDILRKIPGPIMDRYAWSMNS